MLSTADNIEPATLMKDLAANQRKWTQIDQELSMMASQLRPICVDSRSLLQ